MKDKKPFQLVYQFCKENGICVTCWVKWAVENKSLCFNCAMRAARCQISYRKRKKEKLVS